MSSPVYDLGASITAHSASSASSPLFTSTMATRRSAWEENAANGIALRSRGATIAIASGPLTRITPIALSPIAVAIATIVSSARGGSGSAGVFGLARRARARGSVHEPLLQDLQDVGHGPVEDESRRQVEEHEREDDWHEQHHPRLTRIAHCRRHLLLHEHRDAHEHGQHVDRIVRRQIADPEIEAEEMSKAQERRAL